MGKSKVSRGSAGSILSIGSSGSILSIGSAGSILSIGSAGSILSVGSVGSFASAFSVGSFASFASILSGLSARSIRAWRPGQLQVLRRGRRRDTRVSGAGYCWWRLAWSSGRRSKTVTTWVILPFSTVA